MTSDAPDPVASEERSRPTDEDLVWWATWIGVLLALVGAVDGLMMALKKKVATCPDGKFFPEGTTDLTATCTRRPGSALRSQ